MAKTLTIADIRQKKLQQQKIVTMTAYDYPGALIASQAGVDILLVGDSLGNVVLGYETTIPVTMDDMLLHVKPVSRGADSALVVADLPFGSYHCGTEEALKNAVALIKEGGATAVKLEGGDVVAPLVQEITRRGIPVMAHIGLLPQTASLWEGYRVQGRDAAGAQELLASALALEAAGAFSIVLECVAAETAQMISTRLRIPTIGIGSGPYCDGQVLVFHDTLGLNQGHVPRFVKRYCEAGALMQQALTEYAAEVRAGTFPDPDHSFPMAEEEAQKLHKLY